MEKLIQRENVHVGYGKSPDSEDLDFNDVFGGPPRRFSMQEVRERYSFSNSEEETASPPWGALKEKPVFGEESTPRRRRKGTDFFNDIFKGGDGDRDSTFGSNPSSRIMSPRADSLGTSLPAASAQFSLPAKSTKAMDLPTFGSQNHGQYKVDGGGNGFSSPQSWSALSRFSNEAAPDDSHKNEVRSVDSVENQFHFSIYKWAGKGVPMLMPLIIGNNLKSNTKYEESLSSNERMDIKSASVKKQVTPAASKEEEMKSVDENSKGERIENEVPVKVSEGLNSEGKPLHAFLVEDDQPGETKDARDSKKGKERGRREVDSKKANSEATQVKSAAGKGKVKEFVQIFKQEADVKGSRSSRMGNVGTEQKGVNVLSSNPTKVKDETNPHNAAKKPDVSFKVVEDLKNETYTQRSSPTKTPSHTRTRSSTLQRSFSAGTIPKDMKMSPENLDDHLEDNFVVQELHGDPETVPQNESSDETKVIDAKIRQWSVGKKGNIRSLLSTLQYVLWQESGWKPVPLVDLIETNSVKRAYQKALLRLHPDKLQQKGAAFHQKYTAEKVFDILQEAWDHFNTCSSLGI